MDTQLEQTFRAWQAHVAARNSMTSERLAEEIIASLRGIIVSRSTRALGARIQAGEKTSSEDLEELFQSCQVALILALYRYKPDKGAGLRNYLLSVIDGAITATLAEGTAISTPGLHVEDLPDSLPQLAIDWLEDCDLHLVIKGAMQQLPFKWGRIIFLRYFQGYTQSETGKWLGLSQSAVSRIEGKALMLLQEIIGTDPRER